MYTVFRFFSWVKRKLGSGRQHNKMSTERIDVPLVSTKNKFNDKRKPLGDHTTSLFRT